MNQKSKQHILWFKEIGREDGAFVGGKGANLGEMFSIGIPVPNGFVVTSHAYFNFLKVNRLAQPISQILERVDTHEPTTISRASQEIKRLIKKAPIPQETSKEIIKAYLKLSRGLRFKKVAVRSSATAEDLPTASFAGQQETYLGVKGEANVVQRVRDCWASLFEARAIFYREEKKFEHMKVGMAVPVQEMISASVSGVMFTIDPLTNRKNRIVIEAIHGLGEYIVQGKVTPDRYSVAMGDLKIVDRVVEKQTIQLVTAKKTGHETKQAKVPKSYQLKRKLTDKQIQALAKLGREIHRHYFFPQDIEWLLYKNRLYIVQTRPVTTVKQPDEKKENRAAAETIKREPILTGLAASPGIMAGPARVIKTSREINKIKKGDILVTSMTTPDFVPAMKRAVAILTDKGGQTSHAAIVSRELGIPCIVGAKKASRMIKNNQMITVNGSLGEVYKGGFETKPQKEQKATIKGKAKMAVPSLKTPTLRKTATKLYVNLGNPTLAKKVSGRNVDGVGLLRAEFMIADIGVHPKKLIKDGRQKVLVEKLTEGLLEFCKAFYPQPVVYRTTDFKTNEYRNLTGGDRFEPEEENPLIGYRGAFRYIHDPQVFELELEAIRKVRRDFNNLWMMIPFARTPRELMNVKKIITANKLFRSPSFKLWLMVEIPANVILLEEFLKVGIDGVSIGSNDLTMLTLGVDRDNADLADLFDERDPAVLWALERTIKICQKHNVTSSICGQAPSTYPDLTEKLIRWGITSVSVNPDAIETTRQVIYEAEKKVIRGRR